MKDKGRKTRSSQYQNFLFLYFSIDQNEAPTNIFLSSKQVKENPSKGTSIGTFSVIDMDGSTNGIHQQHSYELTSNPKGLFRIAGKELQIAIDCNSDLCDRYGGVYCPLNFESARFHTIKVKVTDSGTPSLSFEKSLTIEVLNANDPPKNIRLTGRTVPENASIGYVIGKVTFTDDDNADKHSVYLSVDDNGRFKINDKNELVKAKSTNYEKQSIHSIVIAVKDDGKPSLNVS